MQITEVRIKLLPQHQNGGDKLRGYCTITLDNEFVIRDLKIIEGARGVFVAMPSRRVTDRCQSCGQKNHLRARFCNECGAAIRRHRLPKDDRGRTRLYVDVAHPINATTRNRVHRRVLEELKREEERSKKAGYVFATADELEFEDGPEEGDAALDGRHDETEQRRSGRESEYDAGK